MAEIRIDNYSPSPVVLCGYNINKEKTMFVVSFMRGDYNEDSRNFHGDITFLEGIKAFLQKYHSMSDDAVDSLEYAAWYKQSDEEIYFYFSEAFEAEWKEKEYNFVLVC